MLSFNIASQLFSDLGLLDIQVKKKFHCTSSFRFLLIIKKFQFVLL